MSRLSHPFPVAAARMAVSRAVFSESAFSVED
jgi:hypothetical protein